MNRVVTLRNGVQMPAVGFGTYKIAEGGEDLIAEAIRTGYRHLDTAAYYKNEETVREGIRRAGVPREDIFLTTKVWTGDMGYYNVMRSFAKSCKRLGTDYLDLYLIHWPRVAANDPEWERTNAETWHALEDLYSTGRVRAIGVSNFLKHHLQSLEDSAMILPMVDQLEYHPGWTWRDTVVFAQAGGMIVEGWSPLGRTRMFENELLRALAEKYGCSVAQLCLRWAMQNGVVPLPKTATPARMRSNLELEFFVISPEDMEAINALPELGWSGLHPDEQGAPVAMDAEE